MPVSIYNQQSFIRLTTVIMSDDLFGERKKKQRTHASTHGMYTNHRPKVLAIIFDSIAIKIINNIHSSTLLRICFIDILSSNNMLVARNVRSINRNRVAF